MSDFKSNGLLSTSYSMPASITTHCWRMFLVGTCICLLCGEFSVARSHASDGHVLSEIFGDSVIGENVVALRRQLADRSDEEQFQILSDWVLPGRSHLHFRLEGAYTPANSTVGSADGDSHSTERRSGAESPEASRVQMGGNPVAPAFDLVDVASRLGRLGELRSRVEQIDTDNVSDQRARLSMLFLISLAQGDNASATASLTQLFDVFRESDHASVSERWPETLAVIRGVLSPDLKIASELLYMNYEKYVNDLHGWRKQGNDLWDGHFFSLLGSHRLREQQGPASTSVASPPALKSWVPVGHFTAQSRGQGLPKSSWHWNGQQVSSVSGHDQDFLMFRSPLQGNFEIECEVTSSTWHDMSIFAAGQWVHPYWNRAAVEIGNVRGQRPNAPLEIRMARFGETAQHRVVIRDGVYSAFYNGRRIYEESIEDKYDPWIAIRSKARSIGTVRNVRISGQPTVPSEINLADQKTLPGWFPYYQESVSEDGAWWHDDTEGSSGIIGKRTAEIAGTINESLLTYHRPMLEDGTIDYEFFYEPGQSLVHPAMDRLSFLLTPAGIDVHWVTDGAFDRTESNPANRTTESENRRNTGPLPLKQQAWNSMRFSLRGDTVTLELNGELIYERLLEVTNQRTFGLFHYSDQTEARVRNIVWQGDWPKHLSPLQEQELFLPDHECLDGTESLKEVFTHTFTDEFPDGQLELSGTQVDQSVTPHVNGFRVAPPTLTKWTGVKINYLKPIYGDFDATLEFENLADPKGMTGACDQMILATDESGVMVRTSITQSSDEKSYMGSVMTLPLPDGKKRYIKRLVPDETRDGTLRLVRRGATMHSLIASGDSPNFRHIGSHELPSAASAILLASMTGQNAGGAGDVVVKTLTVRSNTTAFESKIDPRVTSVNQFTASLFQTHRHRFAASGAEGFSVAGEQAPVKSGEGLRVRAGEDTETGSVTLGLERILEGDFDISATLNASGLATSDSVAGTASMSVSNGNEQAVLHIRRTSNESFEVTAYRQRGGSASPQTETVASETVSSIDSLRLVRIQKTMIFIYSEGGLPRMLGHVGFESSPVPEGGVQLTVGAQSGSVLWKSFAAKKSSTGR